jgi:hypothetical protein
MPRNQHPLSDLLHVGFEPDSAIELSGDIGPFPAGTTVHDFLAALDVMIEGYHSPSFTLDAVQRKTIQNIGAWTWVRRLSSGSDFAYINGFANSGGLWVAVGDTLSDAGQVYWARDPEGTWTRQPGWPQLYYGSVATDGTTWAIAGEGRLVGNFGVIGSPDTFLAGHLWTNSDPTHDHYWVQRLNTSDGFGNGPSLFGVLYANSHWVTWGASGSGAALYTAGTNPTGTWTSRSTSAFDTPGPADITFGNGTWVALSGDGSTISTASAPTSTWTNQGTIGVPGADKIKYANGYWLIVGTRVISGVFHGGPWYATSPTGTWTEVSAGMRVTVDMVWDGTRWVVLGTDNSFNPRVVVATDPTGTWTSVGAPNFNDPWRLAFDGRVYVAGGVGDAEETAIETALNFAYTAVALDAFIAGRVSINAVVRRTPTGSFTVDAIRSQTTSSSFTIDAVIQALTFTVDALLLKVVAGSFTTNAFMPGHFSINAFVPGWMTFNAVLFRTTTGALTSDAFIPGHFTIDATLTGFTVDAVIVSAMDSFQSDAFQDGVFQ